MTEWWHERIVIIFQDIILMGAALTASFYGIKRVYNMARGVEKILEFSVTEKKAREELAKQVNDHIALVATQHHDRDLQIREVVDTVREISRETRPNGGSSMKDVLNHTAAQVNDVKTRLAVLEEWKRQEEA